MGMAAVIPTPTSEVVDELHPAPKPGEDEEIVDLSAPAPKPEAVAPAAPAAAPAAPAAPAVPAPSAEDEIPEEYRGKTPAQLAKMLKDAQSVIGRQGSELGDFRKKADLLIQASLENLRASRAPAAAPAPQQPAPATPPEDVDFFAKPADAVAKMIEASPVIQEIRKTLGAAAAQQAEARATAATERFNAAHPDAGEIMANPEFQNWVKASRVRTQLLHRAHTNFDFDAGDEVFGTWKALRGAKAPAAPAAPAAPDPNPVSEAARTLAAARKKQALQDAAAPTSGNASPAKSESRKIYRRADVIKLMTEQPERYEELAPEIELAYKEGRVR